MIRKLTVALLLFAAIALYLNDRDEAAIIVGLFAVVVAMFIDLARMQRFWRRKPPS